MNISRAGSGALYSVRDATADDVEFIVDCNMALAEESEGKKLDRAVLSEGVIKGLARTELCRYFVAQRERERVGTTMLTYELTDWRSGLIWWLQSVYVPPEFRQRGVFRAIYRHIEALARRDPEVRALRLYVMSDNHRARRTYEAMGMSHAGYEVYEDELGGQAT